MFEFLIHFLTRLNEAVLCSVDSQNLCSCLCTPINLNIITLSDRAPSTLAVLLFLLSSTLGLHYHRNGKKAIDFFVVHQNRLYISVQPGALLFFYLCVFNPNCRKAMHICDSQLEGTQHSKIHCKIFWRRYAVFIWKVLKQADFMYSLSNITDS